MNNQRESLDSIAQRTGTDKRQGQHGYTRHYEELWSHRRDSPITSLEFGVAGGDSLRMWREYFTNATIVGVDVDPNCRRSEDSRVHIHIGRQEDQVLAQELRTIYPNGFDIIIDDGGHYWEEQQATLALYLPMVRCGGDYVIEDLHTSYWDCFRGYGSRSTIEFLKTKIDDLMVGRKLVRADPDTGGRDKPSTCEAGIESIRFYKSLVVFRKGILPELA